MEDANKEGQLGQGTIDQDTNTNTDDEIFRAYIGDMKQFKEINKNGSK